MKAALITGVAGQDGAYLAQHLLGLGYRVLGTVPDAPIPPGFVEAYLTGVDLRVVDLTDRRAMRELLEREHPDEIYNLASISSVAQSWQMPLEVTAINGVAVLGLLDEVRSLRDQTGYDPRICQASSSEIFGPPRRLPQAEGEPIAPTNPYGVAKSLAHLSAVNYRDAFGLYVSTVILFNHESPLRPAAFVTRKITSAVVEIAQGRRDHLELGRLDVLRDWGAAADYVRAMRLALQAPAGGDYVVATGESHTLGAFVQTALDSAGVAARDGLVVTNPAFVRPTDIVEMRGDPSHAEQELGWRREVSFRALVEAMVEVDRRRLASGVEHEAMYLRIGAGERG